MPCFVAWLILLNIASAFSVVFMVRVIRLNRILIIVQIYKKNILDIGFYVTFLCVDLSVLTKCHFILLCSCQFGTVEYAGVFLCFLCLIALL